MKVKIASWREAEAELAAIRRSVFIDEQAVPEDLEWDGEDEQALHVLVTEGDEAIGCGRMLADGHIGRMAVMKDFRGRGAGRLILKTLLMQAEKLRRGRVFLNAQTHAAGFYAKYGFNQVGGEFPDANIPHVRMEKTLDNFSETTAALPSPAACAFRTAAPACRWPRSPRRTPWRAWRCRVARCWNGSPADRSR